jgi:hypothetical protein
MQILNTKFFVLWAYKIIKYDKNYRFENIHTQIDTFFIFWGSLAYKVFEQDFSHICGINSWQHPNIFIQIETSKCGFHFFKATRSLVSRNQNCPLWFLDTHFQYPGNVCGIFLKKIENCTIPFLTNPNFISGSTYTWSLYQGGVLIVESYFWLDQKKIRFPMVHRIRNYKWRILAPKYKWSRSFTRLENDTYKFYNNFTNNCKQWFIPQNQLSIKFRYGVFFCYTKNHRHVNLRMYILISLIFNIFTIFV